MNSQRKYVLKNISLLLFFAMGIFLAGCRNSLNHLQYKASPASIIARKVQVNANLVADMKKGVVILQMKVKNESNAEISVDYFKCNLIIDAERGTTPVVNKTFKTKLSPNEEETYKLFYRPVNAMNYFNKIGYRGDMKQKYRIKVDFIKDSQQNLIFNKNFTFELDNNTYHNYLKQYGRESKIQLFDWNFNRDTFIFNQKQYFAKNILEWSPVNSMSNFVFVTKSQININNRIINIVVYRQNDTLSLNFLILNMGISKIKVVLNKINLTVADSIYHPKFMTSNFFNYNRVTDSTVIVRQGDRFGLKLKYKITGNYNKYKLATKWLLIQRENSESGSDDYLNLFYKTDLPMKLSTNEMLSSKLPR